MPSSDVADSANSELVLTGSLVSQKIECIHHESFWMSMLFPNLTASFVMLSSFAILLSGLVQI